MTSLIRITVIIGLLLLASSVTGQEARVVRVLFNTNKLNWTISVNHNGNSNHIDNANLTNELARLQLHHGDILLFEGFTLYNQGAVPRETWDWLNRYRHITNRVGIFSENRYLPLELFDLPVYHWLAPFDNPSSMTNAAFFFEGKLLGTSMAGYTNMLSHIAENKSYQVYILGSAYERWSSSFSMSEKPYADYRDMLDRVLNETGKRAIQAGAPP